MAWRVTINARAGSLMGKAQITAWAESGRRVQGRPSRDRHQCVQRRVQAGYGR
jgi:hypothetical protein